MSGTPSKDFQIPGDWYRPTQQLARVLIAQLQRTFPDSELASAELIAYHQNRDDVLVRRRGSTEGFAVIHLSKRYCYGKPDVANSPIDFEGTFSEFVSREQRRYEIERRMIEKPNTVPGLCPVCLAPVSAGIGCGIWSGSRQGKGTNGPLYDATCGGCGSRLVALPTKEEAAEEIFVWEFYKWG